MLVNAAYCLSNIGTLSYVIITLQKIRDIQLQRCDKVKDLGVIIDSSLTFEDHIKDRVNKAYSILGLIKRNFEHIGRDAFV